MVSQGYVRMVRNELWSDTPKEKARRLAIFAVLGHALSTLDMLLHPVTPYLTEYLHQEVFTVERMEERRCSSRTCPSSSFRRPPRSRARRSSSR